MPPCPPEDLATLTRLPRPIYGHAESLTNRALGYPHAHPWIQFAHATAGVLDVRTDAGRFIAPPQRAVWIPAGVVHQVRGSEDTVIRSLYIEPSALPDSQGCRRSRACARYAKPSRRNPIHATGWPSGHGIWAARNARWQGCSAPTPA